MGTRNHVIVNRLERAMTVRCEGDCKVMEQLGEKQDFEAELSRQGFAHEAFLLYVRRGNKSGSGGAWAANYSVRVSHIPTRRQGIYWGGPGEHWVNEFATDIARGFYGPPNLSSTLVRLSTKSSRPRLVASTAKRP
jgi:hypothetical protein